MTSAVPSRLLLACVQGFSVDVTWQLHLDVSLLSSIGAALAIGCSLILAAMALGMMMQSGTQQRVLQLGAAITLCAVGIKGLGVDLPQAVGLGPFFCGCAWSMSAVLHPHVASFVKGLRHSAGDIGHDVSTLTSSSDLPAFATYLTRNDIVTSC
ncbi:MAG: hypothetical protein ETSY2_45030 [Candidatus Entotheonella gemina]|uniref:Uncharacterized protein n=1 Tax=Candidatus Entotheonella gemina TaxID=1429439 RepID=W4LIP2_9BACT|nr:MAG: hypothetical protein ETSY2_45030 [Candidatus Entotheonella gemina]